MTKWVDLAIVVGLILVALSIIGVLSYGRVAQDEAQAVFAVVGSIVTGLLLVLRQRSDG